MTRPIVAFAVLVASLAMSAGLASAQVVCGYDAYTGERVCQRTSHTVEVRQPVCYPVYAQQCAYDGWGNRHCWTVEQERCR